MVNKLWLKLIIFSVQQQSFVIKPYRVMTLNHIVALVMLNKSVKFQKISLNSIEGMAKLNFFTTRLTKMTVATVYSDYYTLTFFLKK